MFNLNRRSTSRRQGGGFWASAWSGAALAALTSLTFSVTGLIYLMRHAIETNDEMILRACLASPLFLVATLMSLGLMAKQGTKYFADGFHASQQPASQLPLENSAEIIDAVARLVVQQQGQIVQAQLTQLPNATLPMLPHTTRNIMDALRHEECILVWGQKKAGKTTVLLHMIRDRMSRGHEVRVFDPHGSPAKWNGIQPIGGGRKYNVIEEGLLEVVGLMTERYEEIDRGEVAEGDHDYLTVIVDEYRGIVKNTKKAKESIATLLTEARKTNIHIAVISHSKSVKALGLEGEGDLREGFAVAHILKDEHGNRRSEVSLNGDPLIEMALPGPFQRNSRYGTSTVPVGQPVSTKPVPAAKSASTKPVPASTSAVSAKKERSVAEIIEELRKRGKGEPVIVKFLAKKYPKLSANAIWKISNLGRNKALAIVRAVRNPEEVKQKQSLNGHENRRVI